MKLTVAICVSFGCTTLFAAKTRSSEPVTFTTKGMSITIAPDGATSLKRNGKAVSSPESPGWSIYCWTDCPKGGKKPGDTRTQLDNMAKIGPNELLLWSSKKHFEVKVAITPKGRYFTIELLHVSNDAKTGGLNGDWQGHRVEFELRVNSQQDGWKLHQLKLNPMTRLAPRTKHLSFSWPYAYWAQTDDRPQPQGAIAFYGYVGDEEHDDILTDIWVGEPSLPRPNRANLTSWTRSDVKAWLDRFIKERDKEWVTASFSPKGKAESIYEMADIAGKTGINRIYLHNFDWQGKSVGLPSPSLFPNGLSDVDKWREYCSARGIDIALHGFGGLYRNHDIKFGPQYKPDGLVRSARGTLVNDVAGNQKTLLVEPDLSLYPWLKPGMPPFTKSHPWGVGGSEDTFPPYFTKTDCGARINGEMYEYSFKITKDNLWEITLQRGRKESNTFKAGDLVEFIVHGTLKSWHLADPRSKMYEEMAKDYANILNHFQGNPLYDGAGMCGTYGWWAVPKMMQMVYERLEHPSDGYGFGHFDQKFRRIQKVTGGTRPTTVPMVVSHHASYAGGPDDMSFACSSGVHNKGFMIRGNHRGIYIEDSKTLGVWDKALEIISLWSKLKPHLSEDQKSLVKKRRNKKNDDYFVASETDTQWHLTKTRAMRRKGDRSWARIPERPDVAPRQFLKADGKAIKGLQNPYTTQTADIQVHVMASMKPASENNISLMAKNKKDIVFTGTNSNWSAKVINTYNITRAQNAAMSWDFSKGALELSVDNSRSENPYIYRPCHLGGDMPVAEWLYSSIDKSSRWGVINMTKHRGVAVTVEGDGSGAVLFVKAGSKWGRIYAIEVDFVGKRTIEIPNGEAHINRYGFVGSITAFRFNKVDKFFAFITEVPAGKKAKIKILDIQAMYEDHNVGLIDPVLTLNDQRIQVTGTVPYNHYLTYTKGSVAKVYGPNWHFVKDVAVTANESFVAVKGNNTFSVKAAKSPDAWLSSRIKVQDSENRIIISKPKGGVKPVKTAVN
jgi:hypothetical protein